MTVEQSKRRSYFLSLVFITKCLTIINTRNYLQFLTIYCSDRGESASSYWPNEHIHWDKHKNERTVCGRMGILCWSRPIPGRTTVILRGPLNPSTFVSCGEKSAHHYLQYQSIYTWYQSTVNLTIIYEINNNLRTESSIHARNVTSAHLHK